MELKLPVITQDFETYYDDEYSLSKMTTEEYINDPRFEIIGVTLKYNDEPPVWITGGHHFGLEYTKWMTEHRASQCAVVAHNAYFDGAITAWKYPTVMPKLWLCTRAMANQVARPFTRSMSLSNLLQFYGVGAKGTFVANAKGVHLGQFTAEQLEAYATYGKDDAVGCYNLLQLFLPCVQPIDLVIMDSVLRMFFDRRLILDAKLLEEALEAEQNEKDRNLAIAETLGATPAMLRSNPGFAKLMEGLGYGPIPMKISMTTGKEAFALAKNDMEFMDWQEDNRFDPTFNALVDARLSQKSTQAETRTARLLDIAQRDGRLPVPLMYWGAHTSRKSGMEKINLQNLRRGSALRNAICARPGETIIVADQSQIEARFNAYNNRQDDMLDRFARGDDEYCEFATTIYGRPITKDDAQERFVGKVGVLSLGYGAGAAKFRHMLRGYGRDVDLAFADQVTTAYRSKYQMISAGWKQLDYAIQCMANGSNFRIDRVGVTHLHCLQLDCGIVLRYHNLRQDHDGWKYDYAGAEKRLWGSKLDENICQTVSARAIDEQMVTLRGMGLPTLLNVHDELVFMVEDQWVPYWVDQIKKVMSTPPAWAQGIPLAVEVGVGKRYGEAK